ncbi:hypothetical protein AYJ57_24560 (plasmid) [Salipiger sp. CCB-MM3]|uniref:MFS transporter n=1 Tax=Salipiger sp. CCB-MM3 TaxID=1792508 RepID=UPI00080A993F|nr:MFS transporter [Salipiger sp. CCB-MM3]ANT63651.1 hypothetical protein AYJ57_24560 [Salipiger sp. CCB-MM3]
MSGQSQSVPASGTAATTPMPTPMPPAVWALAAAAGIVVANNYYAQPLLHEIGGAFGVADWAASWISGLTQLGYTLGLLLILPLGDRMDRRRLVSVMLLLSCAALLGFAAMQHYPGLLITGFAIGLVSIVPQIMPPVARKIVAPQQRASAIGRVMAGLLLGIVLSRFVGGWLGHLLGWRAVYLLAAAVMLGLLLVLRRAIPAMPPDYTGSYLGLLRSLPQLWRAHADLRRLALAAALQFGAFSLFWSTFAFHLAALPQHYTASMVGNFALVGALGVLGAMASAPLTRRLSLRATLALSGALMALAFPVFTMAGAQILWIVPGVILLDLGMQISHVSSMTRVLELDESATSRLNTVYMVVRFSGAAAGTVTGGLAWTWGGWPGVCLVGMLACAAGLWLNCHQGRR